MLFRSKRPPRTATSAGRNPSSPGRERTRPKRCVQRPGCKPGGREAILGPCGEGSLRAAKLRRAASAEATRRRQACSGRAVSPAVAKRSLGLAAKAASAAAPAVPAHCETARAPSVSRSGHAGASAVNATRTPADQSAQRASVGPAGTIRGTGRGTPPSVHRSRYCRSACAALGVRHRGPG